MAAEATFRYIPHERNQESVCFTLDEKEMIERYMPRARFEPYACDLDEKYNNKVACKFDRYSSIYLKLLERNIFSYSNNAIDLLFYAYEGGYKTFNRVIKSISYSTYEFLIDQLYYGEIGSKIFLNCRVSYFSFKGEYMHSHKIGISVTKTSTFGQMYIQVYDTITYDSYMRKTMTEALQKLYNNLSNLDIDSPDTFYIPIIKDGTDDKIKEDEIIEKYGHLPHKKTEIPEWKIYKDPRLKDPRLKEASRQELFDKNRMINLFVTYEFNEYFKRKNINEDSIKVSLQDGERIFESGMCSAWTLYFIVEIYINGKTSYDVYDLLGRMSATMRAKFIYVYYDLLLFALKIEGDLDLESLSPVSILK